MKISTHYVPVKDKNGTKLGELEITMEPGIGDSGTEEVEYVNVFIEGKLEEGFDIWPRQSIIVIARG